MSLLNRIYPKELSSPKIDLGIKLDEGLGVLGKISTEIEKDDSEKEGFYRATGKFFSLGFYTDGVIVTAAWYDDPLGRLWKPGKRKKIQLYLARYGKLENWECRLDNGWIRHYFNDSDGIHVAYGIHMDVIRINMQN